LRTRHTQVLNEVNTLATQPPTTASSTNAHVCGQHR
jgi:hypothetical protein